MLSENEKYIIIAQGIALRIKWERPWGEEPDAPEQFVARLDGSSLFGEGIHPSNPREAMQRAWNAYWLMAEGVINSRIETGVHDPLANAIRMYREAQV